MFAFFHLLFTKLRLSNPWKYKAPFLISIPYFLMLVTDFEVEEGLLAIGCSFTTILGIAGFGYWANDFSDREEDRRAGKANALIDMPLWAAIFILILFLAAAILPWVFYFPVTLLTGSLLGLEFLLFCLYSLPPFRFKERGILGPVTDALYAHVNPAILAALTFEAIAPAKYPNLLPYLVALGVFQLGLGIRNILLHQLQDYENDSKSGAHTFVIGQGLHKSWNTLRFVFLPLEWAGFFSWMVILSLSIPWFLLSFPIFLAYTVFRVRILWQQPLPGTLRKVLYQFFDDFYAEWVPVLILGVLCWEKPWFLLLFGVHFLLFRNALWHIFKDLYSRLS